MADKQASPNDGDLRFVSFRVGKRDPLDREFAGIVGPLPPGDRSRYIKEAVVRDAKRERPKGLIRHSHGCLKYGKMALIEKGVVACRTKNYIGTC